MSRLTNTSVDSRNSNAVRLFCDTETALKKLKKYEDIGEVEEFKNLKEENEDLKKLSIGLLKGLKMQVDMFAKTDEKDGEHTLRCSHEYLMKLKNKLIEIMGDN